MIKLSFREPVYQETTTKDGLKVVTCIIMYRPKGIECHGGPGFTEAVGIDSRYRKAVGTAVCDPHDAYDVEVGKKLARSRAKDAAYSGFYNTVRESREKFNHILANLEKNLFAKAEMVKTRNRNYRKNLGKVTPVKETVAAALPAPAKPRRSRKITTTPAVETKTKAVEVKAIVKKPAKKVVVEETKTTRRGRKKAVETTK